MSLSRSTKARGGSDLSGHDQRPHPGTRAYQNLEPELIPELRALVSNRTNRRDVVAMLTGRGLDRKDVDAAHTYWLRQMPKFAWDDYTGTDVLMILEEVLREIPRGE